MNKHGLAHVSVPVTASFFQHYRLTFVIVLLVLGSVLLSVSVQAACSPHIGKVTINEYNFLGSNNTLGTYVEVKLLPVPVGPSSGQTPLTDISGWTLKYYSKTGALQDTKLVSAASVGGCTDTLYRVTAMSLGSDGYVHLLDTAGDLVDVLYIKVPVPLTAVGCSLATITIDKDIQGADANRKNISRNPDGIGDWRMSLGNGNNSEQTICADNLNLLKVTKLASVATLFVGELVTFTMTVTNSTQYTTLSNVTLVDTLPAGLTRTVYTAPAGTTFNTATNTWTIATMLPGASHTMTLTARADKVGSWINSAIGNVTYSDVLFQSSPATATVTALQPLTLTKAVSPATVPYNTAATFTVSVKNNSPAALPSGFTVNDPLPAGLTAGAPTVSAGGGTYAGGEWTILSSMPAGATHTLTIPVTSQTEAGSFTNTATAVAPFGGENLTASATLAVGLVVSNFNAFEKSTAANAIIGNIYTKLAGTAFSLDIVAIGAGVQATGFNDNVKLELLANTGTPGTGYGSDNCPASNSLIQTIPTAAIANGRSTASFPAVAQAYRDVRVRVTYQNQTVMACSTDSFAIRPSAVTLLASPIMATAPSASATPTIKAGANFTLTAATSPAAGYAGTLTLDTNKLTAQTTIQDSTEQGGGVIGTLTPVSLTANASASNNAAYTEVGYLYLAPGTYRDDAYTSVDQPNDCISSTTGDANLADSLPGGKVGCSIGNTTAVAFGRFVPHHFDVSISPNPPAFVDNCTDFTYLGQPFAWAAPPQLTIRARNSANAVTQNYEGAFWKLIDPLPFLTYVDANVPASASPLTPATSSQALPDTSNCDGIVTLALAESFNYTRPAMTSPLSPFVPAVSLSIAQANLTDTDSVCYDLGAGVGCQGFVVSGITGTHMRHGQVKIFNNFGPETADITHSPFEVQYYDGTKWVANSDDTCTTGLSFCPSATISAVQPVPLIPGKWTFTVSKPDSLTVCPTAPSWLTALTDCTLPNSSCGEFTFGIYRGNDRIINWQEVMR